MSRRKTNTLDPRAPGVPISASELHQRSKEFQKQHGGALVNQPSINVKSPDPNGPPIVQIEQPSGGVQPTTQPPPIDPEQLKQDQAKAQANLLDAIPTQFQGGDAATTTTTSTEENHPVLEALKTRFGIQKLRPIDVELGDFKWTFRPTGHLDYEWTSANCLIDQSGRPTLPSLTVANVAIHLAAINDVPLYELMGLDVKGRVIRDPLNPPTDIRLDAADLILRHFRNDMGMWEIVGRLEEQYSPSLEQQRKSAYDPFWEELADPLTVMLAGGKGRVSKTSSKETNDGNFGEKPLPEQEFSPQTHEQ